MMYRLSCFTRHRRALRLFAACMLAAISVAPVGCSEFGDEDVPTRPDVLIPTSDGSTSVGDTQSDATAPDAGDAPDSGSCEIGDCRLVFVTSDTIKGSDIESIASADTTCSKAASKGATAKGRIFKAWLSDGAKSVADRFTKDDRPFRRTDGVLVATSWSDLTTSTTGIRAPIVVDEKGLRVEGSMVWTGTLPTGATGATCSDWQNVTGTGTAGRSDQSTQGWTAEQERARCAMSARLYCFEQ